MSYMRSSCVYEPIYTVKNLYNDFIILQDFFLRGANNSHIEIYLFPRHLPHLSSPILVNRNDYWIVVYWLSTYGCWCCMKYFSMQPKTSTFWGIKHTHHKGKQTVVSVFCPVNTEFTHHDPNNISPYDKKCVVLRLKYTFVMHWP